MGVRLCGSKPVGQAAGLQLDKSGYEHRAGTTRKGSRWLWVALIEAANAAARGKDTYLASQYARLKGRRGHK